MDEIFIKIDNVWFDVSNFNTHPGGKKILRRYHLRDASEVFNDIKGHHDTFALNFLENFEIRISDTDKLNRIKLLLDKEEKNL